MRQMRVGFWPRRAAATRWWMRVSAVMLMLGVYRTTVVSHRYMGGKRRDDL
jgi:hypothetical protein